MDDVVVRTKTFSELMSRETRTKRLRALLKRVERNPLGAFEQRQLERLAVVTEACLAAQVDVLALEKRDVEELENPWTRLVLVLSGQLATREPKEKREYDAALAETLRLGNLNAQIQAVMPSVPCHPSGPRLAPHAQCSRHERAGVSLAAALPAGPVSLAR